MKSTFKRSILAISISGVVASTGLFASAHAQTTGARSGLPDELVVTAERREKSLQKTPVAITAFTQNALDISGVFTTVDLQQRTPGLNIKMNSILGQPYIRGIGTDIISAGADASVAIFVDDVYQARSASSIQDFYDVERVEVLKGPQSTLFGRNVTGGAIRLFSRRPQPDLEASADVLYGSYDKLRVRGMINVPLAGDKAMFRASGLRSRRDGYTDNLFNGKDLDDEDFWSGRAQLLLQPTDAFQIHIIGDLSRERSSRFLASYPEVGCCASLGLTFGGTVPSDPRKVFHDTQDKVDVDAKGVTVKLTYETGAVTLTSVTGYRRTEFLEVLDLDATEIPAATNSPVEDSKTFTQDLQLASSETGPFNWIAGLYYLKEDVSQTLNIALPIFMVTDNPSGDVDTKAYAAYGQFSYDLTDQVRATAGVRYSYEKRSIVYTETISDPFGAITGAPGVINLANTDSETWSSWTPKFGLEYSPINDVLLYASVTRGFKAGGFNTNALQPSFEPESLWAYEVGAKSSLLGDRVRLNASAFWYDYSDIQQLTLAPGAPVGAFPIVINAAAATVKGIEAELLAELFPGLTLDASLTLLDAEFDEFLSVDPNNPLGDPDRSGQRMPQAPEASAFVALQYEHALEDVGSFTARGEWAYQSSVFFNSFADPVVSEDAYSLFNARLSFESPDGRWRAAVFGRNLTDKLYARNRIRQDPLVGNLINWADPRTFGVELGFRY